MTRCDSCAQPFDIDDLVIDDAGAWCESCFNDMLRASLANVGGEKLIRAEAELNRQAREQEEA